jgi:hypothetical protein
MITYQELHEEIHQITEISNVFLYLVSNKRMCETGFSCDLFFDYVDKVRKHLDVFDTKIYSLLLKQGDARAREIAERFLSGSIEIKRIFQEYLRTWPQKDRKRLVFNDHDKFLQETREMFELVLNRIQDETEQLYPLVRSITGDVKKVA